MNASVFFYHAYLAEEIFKATNDFTIAKDCGVMMAGTRNGRCNYNQFLEYIWKSSHFSSVQPHVNILNPGEDFLSLDTDDI